MKRIVFILYSLFVVTWLSSCRVYTEAGAKKKFGCDTTSVIDTSKPAVLIKTDTIRDTIRVKGETIRTQSPCDEISKMKPGQKTTQKKGGTTQTYGKDSSGVDFFQSECDSVQKVSERYREMWLKTVYASIYRTDPVYQPTKWEVAVEKIRNFMAVVGVLALFILILKYYKSS